MFTVCPAVNTVSCTEKPKRKTSKYISDDDQGFDLCCFQYVCEFMTVHSVRDGEEKTLTFSKGYSMSQLEKESTTKPSGTHFHFKLDSEVFDNISQNIVLIVETNSTLTQWENGRVSRPWAVAFALIMGVMGIIAWEDWYSVLAVCGLVINSYAMSFSNPNNIRKSILITSPMVIIYDGFAMSFGGMVYESVVIISSIVGLVRYRKNKTEKNRV